MLDKIYKECKPQEYMTVFLLFVIDQLSNTTVSDLIDEEIITFLPLEFLKTNRGTTKRRILERLQSHEVNTETKHALGKMTSWHVLEIIRVMFHSLEEAKKYGLGTRINPSTTSYKTFPLKTPAERRKKEKHKKNRELRQRKLLELQQKNEKNIKSCFSVTPAYWGIDNCTVSILSPEVTYDPNVFDEQTFKETVSLNYNSEGELDKITIQSEDLGKVTISLKEEDYKKRFAAIQLNGPSPNFQTTGINGIKLRLLEVLHKLERDYKIKIKYNPDYVRFKKIELAFTIAFDKLPSLQTRQLLIRSLAKEKKADLKNHRTSKNADGFSMITSKINQKEIHTFYNKIEKAKKNKQIRKINSSLNNLEIFRYEIELTDNNIANKLDYHVLTELNDEKIIQYL